MADATIPAAGTAQSWLDRPVVPAWARSAALAVDNDIALFGLITLVGFVLRIWDVGGRAMHHDESLHAFYAWQAFVGQGYSYDPLMHGPFQFEVVPLFYLLFGASDFSARLLAVVLGTALVFLPFFLRRYLTRTGAALTAGFIAVSPGLVYFSRFIRDDIYLACFSLALFICIVRYLEDRRPVYFYVAAAMAALAMASMEAAYITFFIFGSFLVFQAIRERFSGDGVVLPALRATSVDVWLTALSVFVVITVLLYSTFFTNPKGIWDPGDPVCLQNCLSLHPIWSSSRKDIIGGIAYWLAQHSVQRGGQPWFYYLLLIPLYEQVAVVFGIAGVVYGLIRRSLVTTFLIWWALLSLLVYSWAGEKMPWLSIHITLPLLLLAGLFAGRMLDITRPRRVIVPVAVALCALLALEVHSTFMLNYQDGANPTEMYIYVQTSPDVPRVVSELRSVSHRLYGNTSMPIGVDTTDVGGWPFTWYLRDFTHVSQTTTFSGPACAGRYCSVLLMLEPEYNQFSAQLASRYVVQKYRWNWWFPEDYKDWFPQHWTSALHSQGPFLQNVFGTGADLGNVWNWMLYRQPFGARDARWLYVLVDRNLVPNAKFYSTKSPSSGPPPAVNARRLTAALSVTLESVGTAAGKLQDPRGLAASPDGTLFVSNPLTQKILAYSGERVAASWGQAGSGVGDFAQRDSPQAVAVGPDGKVYVADTWNQRIEVFTRSGRFVRQWGGTAPGTVPGQYYGPRSIAVASTGRVYIADTGNKRILMYSTGGKFLSTWGTAGTGPGQFNEPSSVSVGRDGNVYVADFWNQRIQTFSPTGVYLRSWSVPDWVPNSYDEPYISVDPRSGRVFAADPAQRQVLMYTSTGRLLGALGTSRFALPIGVAALPGNRVAVSDATSNRVDIFTLNTGNPTAAGKWTPGPALRGTVTTKKLK